MLIPPPTCTCADPSTRKRSIYSHEPLCPACIAKAKAAAQARIAAAGPRMSRKSRPSFGPYGVASHGPGREP